MKKIGFLFATIIMLMLFAVSASALEPTGQCGDNVYWEYDSETQELVISGEGEMWDYYQTGSPFYNSNIKKLVVEDGITSISMWTFYSCRNLESVIISDSVTCIGYKAFSYCNSLAMVIISNGITEIEASAFESCVNLVEITIPDSVITIGNSAFGYCTNLTNIIIGNGVNRIGDYAFFECKSLESVSVPSGMRSIGKGAFGYCVKLTNITLPDSIEEIGQHLVIGCERLEKLIIPGKIRTFYTSGVFECDNLSCLTIKNPECQIIIDDRNIPANVILSGYTNSTTEKYAHENDYHFLPLDGENAGVIQNHKFAVDWKTVLPATCTERGLKLRVCCVCSDVVSEVIAPLGHTDKNSDNICDSCDVTIDTDETPSQQPNQPETETPQVEKNFFEKIVEWFRNIFNSLFGWL